MSEMEEIMAGSDDCAAALILSSFSLYSAVFFASGPIGWGLAGVSAASWWLTSRRCK